MGRIPRAWWFGLGAAALGCTPATITNGRTLPDGGHESSASSGSTGSHSGAATGSSSGGTGSSGITTLSLSPLNSVLEVYGGAAVPTAQFTATSRGQPVSPTWSATPPSLGIIDGAGLFTPTGVGGVATISANVGSVQAQTTLTVLLHLSQNGAPDAGAADAGADAGSGAGGIGGVGGEGEGPPVSVATAAVLSSTATADPTLSMLYPYDGTVWPNGLLAPLLQWQSGNHVPDAVSIQLQCPTFTWKGTFGATATPFAHHPIDENAWAQMNLACGGQTVQLQLVFSSGGVAYGPLTESWTVSAGNLRGIVYYNSYGTKLAYNYTGALPNDGPFGGATLAVRGGSTAPVLVAGANGTTADCRVCHTVSSDGSTLLSQQGDDYSGTSEYALRAGNAETRLSPADGRYAWGGLTPDGGMLFSNAAPLLAASAAPSGLFQLPSGTPVPTTGLPGELQAGTPVFSPDGQEVAFLFWGGDAGTLTGDEQSLATMSFNAPGTFGNLSLLFTPDAGEVAIYPSFFPSGSGVVFENQIQSDGRGLGETRSTCDSSGPCSETGALGELWWVDVASTVAARLDHLNGLGTIPVGPNGHGDDSTLNFEPTVSPISSGGYAWVIFTSRRLYGNIATINPYFSDPRFHDISVTPTTKKLWVAAIDLNAPPGSDPSHPAFYLPGQELLAGNSRGYWSLAPCQADGSSCTGGDECCGGYCRATSELTSACDSMGSGCSNEYDLCATSADCCAGSNLTCVNGRCSISFQ